MPSLLLSARKTERSTDWSSTRTFSISREKGSNDFICNPLHVPLDFWATQGNDTETYDTVDVSPTGSLAHASTRRSPLADLALRWAFVGTRSFSDRLSAIGARGGRR